MDDKVESGTVIYSVRLDKVVKQDAEALFSELGMSTSTAINLFLRQSIRDGKVPFEISLKRPNAETIAAIEELEAMRRGEIPERVMSLDEVFGKK